MPKTHIIDADTAPPRTHCGRPAADVAYAVSIGGFVDAGYDPDEHCRMCYADAGKRKPFDVAGAIAPALRGHTDAAKPACGCACPDGALCDRCADCKRAGDGCGYCAHVMATPMAERIALTDCALPERPDICRRCYDLAQRQQRQLASILAQSQATMPPMWKPADVALIGGEMSERDLQRKVEQMADIYGWLRYHTYDSRRSEAGFPDLVLAHPTRGVIFAELKSAKGRVTHAQSDWMSVLKRAPGVEFHLWRPCDLEAIGALLSGAHECIEE